MKHLYDKVKITRAILPSEGAAGTTDIEGAILDMAGFDGVLVAVSFGAITAGAATSIKMQQGAAADMSDAADLEGAGQTIADTDDDKTFYIDLLNPRERYVKLYVDRGTQNAVVASATYVQYGARNMPTTHATGVSGESFDRPAEGTA